MLKVILYFIVVFSIIGIMCLVIKACEIYYDLGLLDKISDDVKNELRKTPAYSLMDEDTKREFKKVNIKGVLEPFIFWVILDIVIFLIFFVTSIIITGKGDTSLFYILWVNVLPVAIFAYFVGRDSLRVARFREIYEIRAYCADIPLVGYSGSKSISLVYYDYKKMQYCIITIPLSAGHEKLYHSFFWAMAVEKGSRLR